MPKNNAKQPICAVCVLKSSHDSNNNADNAVNAVNAVVYLTEDFANKCTKIEISASGLKKGAHGFHIHESGDLTDNCMSLCAHFNPHGVSHGGPNDTSKNRHVGDLGNIVANNGGMANVIIMDKLVKLRGKNSVIGRSMIIHEDPDDLGKGGFPDSKTTGHAGKRIACGVIGYSKSMAVSVAGNKTNKK